MPLYGFDKFAGKTTFSFSSVSLSRSSAMGLHHYHNLFELYFLSEGSCSYFIDNKSYDIKAGDIVLIPEGIIHKTKYDMGNHSRKLMNFSRHYIPKSVIPSLSNMIYVYRNEAVEPKIREILDTIEDEYKNQDDYTSDALKSYTRLLFLLMARNENQADKGGSGSPFIESAVKYIQKNYATEITLSLLAQMHSVSPEHLSRRFKKETGFGFNEYVTLIRLQRAEYMLSESPNVSVSEVAYSCGFNDSNYFSDKFKKEYGVSPLKFRNYNRDK